MIKRRPLWAAAACGVVLGLGGIVAVDATTEPADAQGGFTVSAAQLRINQRISQAAVRRSNEALGLLGPVRPKDGTDKKPVNPFASLARGSGWPTAALADGAVTPSKLSPELRTQVEAPGPEGPPGPRGEQGPAGPISGDAASVNAPGALQVLQVFPVSPNDLPVVETTVPGRLFVTANFEAGGQCTGTPRPAARIVVDGTPVASSFRGVAETSPTVAGAVTASGVTEEVVPAGSHTVRVQFGCAPGTGGGFTVSSGDFVSVSAIVLGN